MLTEQLRRHLLSAAATLCLLAGVAPTGLAEEGQYRSRVLITPESTMTRGAEISIEELEQQIRSIDQPYAKSSAGRHLARHYVEQGEYGKAIEYYRTALAAKGLSDVANREMLRELAQVYLLQENYAEAARTLERVLQIDLVPEVADYLLLAQAHYRMKKYVAVVATLDRIDEQGLTLTTSQIRQALALYYQAGAYAQCERLLRQLLELEPNNPENWHQLVSVYLQQNKRRQALDQLALARQKAVPFSERDVLLLADLQAVNKNPYGAAETLADGLAKQQVPASGDNYRKLFEFWFQAREKDLATRALQKAAGLSGDTELYLYLAQLQMEERQWQTMYQTMLAACTKPLAERFVGRANLLLGVSQLKLGDEEGARRSFINATLIGGANAQAGQWLRFMDAAPTTEDEARHIRGICHGVDDKRLKVAAGAAPTATQQGSEDSAEAERPELQIKTVPPMQLYYSEYDMPLEKLLRQMRSLGMRMGITLVKAGGTADGPLHVIATGDLAAQGDASLQLAVPTRGSPRAGGKFRVRSSNAFKCAWFEYTGPPQDMPAAALKFAEDVQAAGHQLTGERRLLFPQGGGDAFKVELQLGIE